MKLAFLGLGAMGARMAANLIKAGHDVTVWNRNATKAEGLVELGAKAAHSPREAASDADAVFAMVRDDTASRRVWLDPDSGALANMKKDAIAIECSTLSVDWVREWAKIVKDHALSALDAPVVGSRPQAEAAQLVFLVGGEESPLERALPLLNTMGAAVHRCGVNSTGASIKLAVNSLFGIQVAAIAELLGILQHNQVDLARAVEIIGSLPVTSPAVKIAAGSMLGGKFPPLFPVELVEKDFGYAIASASDGAHSAPLADATRKVMQAAIALGFGSENLTGIARLYR